MCLSRTMIKITAFIPMLVVFWIVMLLGVSFFKFGYIPEYGVDKDPNTVFSDGFLSVINWSLIVSFYLLALSFLSLITLLIIRINKVNRKKKIIALGIYTFGILVLVLLRESSAFEWLVD
ncbi:MAG: hypothetical protein DRH21_04505 [Deltaproteobacteria bacterium]|nr:MAG: hypothetical protein DRH21_04505 [Deltaproteobacteria bacterium]